MKGVLIVRKMLTTEEQKERSAKGLCFNYDESYSPRHKCKERLFRMDVDQQCLFELMDQHDNTCLDEIEDLVETTEISMQAFSRMFNPRTIRLMGWVQGWPLSVLIDRGSTHNFIQESVVTRLGYEVEALLAFNVFIGNGEYLVCKEVCRQVGITNQNMEVTKDLFVLSMGSANIVLGI